MTNRPIVYIAGPFRAATAWAIAKNVRAAEAWALEIAKTGAIPFIPHSMYHLFHGELTGQFWVDATLTLLQTLAQGTSDFAVFVIHGEHDDRWRHSTGTIGEIAEALRLSRKVFFASQLGDLQNWIKERINQ